MCDVIVIIFIMWHHHHELLLLLLQVLLSGDSVLLGPARYHAEHVLRRRV